MKIPLYIKFIIPSIVFFVMMKFFFESSGLSYSSLIALFLISALSAFWITKHRLLPVILMMLFTTSSVLFLLTLGKNNFQQLYIVLSSALFTVTLIGLYRFFMQQENLKHKEEMEAKILDSGFNLNQTIVLISIFLLSSGMYGIYLDLDLPVWSIMIAISASVFFSTLYLTKINFLKSKALELHLDSFKNKTFTLYSFLFGFIALELIWIISFLPVNHLTVGAIILSFYYSFWNILRDYLRNKLAKKTVVLNFLFFISATSFIFITSKWEII
jgi:hypothetical protein